MRNATGIALEKNASKTMLKEYIQECLNYKIVKAKVQADAKVHKTFCRKRI